MTLPRRPLPYAIAAIVLTIAAMLFYATRPAATMSAIHHAVETRDYAALNELVDFPALRASARARVMRDLDARAADPSSFGARIGAAIGNLVAGPLIDLAVSPVGLAFILEGYSPKEAARAAGASTAQSDPAEPADAPATRDGISYRTRWQSLSHYTVEIADGGTPVTILELRRYGIFRWKLAGADLAPTAPASVPAR